MTGGKTRTLRLITLAISLALIHCNRDETSQGVASEETETDLAPQEEQSIDAAGARHHPMPKVIFGPWYGSGCPAFGACGIGGATDLAQEAIGQIKKLESLDIPITVYLFDGNAWSRANSGATNSCAGADCCSWKLGDEVIQLLARRNIRALLHFWGGCHEPDQYQRAFDRLGNRLLGFYMDDGSSDADVKEVMDFMQTVAPNNWECVLKAYQNRSPATTNTGLSKYGNVAYVGDMLYDWNGLRLGVERFLAKARYLPAPMNEFTSYAWLDDGIPEEEVYYRRLHFGCFQPVMAHDPFANCDPWRPEYGPDLVIAYRYYAWLHKELVPYFYSHAYRMHEQPTRYVLRAGSSPYSFRVGDEIFVSIVTGSVWNVSFTLPSGTWIDYWNESKIYSGEIEEFPVPTGQEPTFIRLGALVPMDVERSYTGHGTPESQGSLTMLVYPSGTTTYKYRDDRSHSWRTFKSQLSSNRLTLTVDPEPPAMSVLYRIGRWSQAPSSVGVENGIVRINQGGAVLMVKSEQEVNGAKHDAWFYDAAARRLIVKLYHP